MSAVTSVQLDVLHPGLASPIVRNVPRIANEVIKMHPDDLQRLDGDNRWRMIICLKGMIWVTQRHDWRDYVLTPGDIFVVTQRGRVLIEALQEATVEITPSLKMAPYAGDLPTFR